MNTLHMPMVSALCAGLLIILHTVLFILVIKKRAQHKQGIGLSKNGERNAPIFLGASTTMLCNFGVGGFLLYITVM